MMLASALLGGLVSTAGLMMAPAPGDPQMELRWTSIPGCPDHATIARQLDALLGSTERARSVRAVGTLHHTVEAYALHLEIEAYGRRESRRLHAADCALLSRAGVLVIAVTVDALTTDAHIDTRRPPDLVDVPEPPPAVPEPAAPSPAARSTPTPSRPDLSPPARARPRRRWTQGLTLGAGAGVATGMVPGVTGGLEGQLGWRVGPVRLDAAGYHWFSRSTLLQPEAGIEGALSGGRLRVCVALVEGRVEVPLCAGADLAAMHGGGVGSRVQSNDVRDLWVAVAGGTGVVGWLRPRIALSARLEGTLGLRRPAMFLGVDGAVREAFRMPPVGARLVVGPLFRVF